MKRGTKIAIGAGLGLAAVGFAMMAAGDDEEIPAGFAGDCEDLGGHASWDAEAGDWVCRFDDGTVITYSEIRPRPKGGWADGDAPRRIRELAQRVEDVTGWAGLGDFLVAVAWTESRGNPSACNVTETGECGLNSARGWFQLRPKSAFHKQSAQYADPDLLFDERWSVALAAYYADRLRNYAGPRQSIDWLALRRGWAYPSRVSDVDEDFPRSIETRERFEEGVAAAGLPDSFMYRDAFPPGYEWPGFAGVLEAVGLGHVA